MAALWLPIFRNARMAAWSRQTVIVQNVRPRSLIVNVRRLPSELLACMDERTANHANLGMNRSFRRRNLVTETNLIFLLCECGLTFLRTTSERALRQKE